MKEFKQLKITILPLFFIFISRGQISLSLEEVIEIYGTDYHEGIFEGNTYRYLLIPYLQKQADFSFNKE